MLHNLEQSTLPVLISVNICPFVHRAAILLTVKEQEYRRITVDLAQKPDWFLSISPLGKVPALFLARSLTNNQQSETLFESAVINEYLDESFGTPLLSGSPLKKAKSRAWIAYSEQLIFQQYQLMLIGEESEFREKSEAFLGALLKLKPADHHVFFDGDSLGLVDVAIAPLFTRLRYLTSTMAALRDLSKQSPDATRLLKWITQLQEHPAVIDALPDGFDQDYVRYFSQRDSFAMQQAA